MTLYQVDLLSCIYLSSIIIVVVVFYLMSDTGVLG